MRPSGATCSLHKALGGPVPATAELAVSAPGAVAAVTGTAGISIPGIIGGTIPGICVSGGGAPIGGSIGGSMPGGMGGMAGGL